MNRLLLFGILLIAACKTSEKPQLTEGRDIKLESCSWSLFEMNGKPVITPEGGTLLFVDFTKGDNVIHGSGGCNTFNGMYTVHDNLIKLQAMTRTERTCLDTAMNTQESSFFKMLEETEKYSIKKRKLDGVKKDVLELYKDDHMLGVFKTDTIH